MELFAARAAHRVDLFLSWVAQTPEHGQDGHEHQEEDDDLAQHV
ncbi:MAG: hypothetical protein AAFR88_12640 [Pseudomonadota bacterium]